MANVCNDRDNSQELAFCMSSITLASGDYSINENHTPKKILHESRNMALKKKNNRGEGCA